MKSKTSCSESGARRAWVNATLLRKNLTRFWPLWAVYAAVWLIAAPVAQSALLLGDRAQYETHAQLAADAASELLGAAATGGVWISAIFGVLFAMALFSYLCSPRALGMMHAFPIRREGVFLTNYLSGAAVFLGTDVLAAALTAAVQGAAGVLSGRNLAAFFLCTAGQMLFFYSFACFCAMFTGQILALPAFYVILNGLTAGLNLLVQNFASAFLYGYGDYGTPAWVKWLTPVWQFTRRVDVKSDWSDALDASVNIRMTGLSTAAIYAAAGVVLAGLALLLYRRRPSETAGDTVAVTRAKPVFRWGVAICCALSLGQGLYYLLWEQFHPNSANSMPAMLVFLVLAGLVGYYAAEMLMKKSFRVFRKSWRGAAALAAVLVAFGLAVQFDAAGVERRVPDADAVTKMTFSLGGEDYLSGTTSDPELIEEFRQAHQALIADKEEISARAADAARAADGDSGIASGYFQLTYQLKNGGTMARNYNVYYTSADKKNPDGAIARLSALARNPKVVRTALFRNADVADKPLAGGEMGLFDAMNGQNYTSASRSFDAVAAKTILTALNEDIDAERMGTNVFDSKAWERETYANTLTLYYDDTQEDGTHGMRSVDIRFSANATALIAALKAAGVVDSDAQLVTYETLNKSEDGGKAASGVIGGADAATDIYLQ